MFVVMTIMTPKTTRLGGACSVCASRHHDPDRSPAARDLKDGVYGLSVSAHPPSRIVAV